MIGTKGAWRVNSDCYENLANAIVLQAVEDYKVSLKMFKARNNDLGENPDFSRSKLELFFRSEWFMVLTRLDGKCIMEKLQKEVFGDDN